MAKIDKSKMACNKPKRQVSGGKKFDFHFKLENLRFLPGDYTCQITEKVVSRFVSANDDLEYYVALESTSTYEG